MPLTSPISTLSLTISLQGQQSKLCFVLAPSSIFITSKLNTISNFSILKSLILYQQSIMVCGAELFEKAKPYIAMISLQFGYAGMNVITKVSLNHGMSHYVLVVYRHAFATLSIAPFALILERYSSY